MRWILARARLRRAFPPRRGDGRIAAAVFRDFLRLLEAVERRSRLRETSP